MKGLPSRSVFSLVLVTAFMLVFRLMHSEFNQKKVMVTSWDALGYYTYLPATFIYHDIKSLSWFPEIDQKYGVSGGSIYQWVATDNGNVVMKYFGGVAVMQLPFFFVGHLVASLTDHPADGFSAPYQWSIALAALFYFLLGFFLLRKVLLRYFSDDVTAATLLLVGLATNLPQYVSVAGGMSHVYLFALYSLMLYLTIKWHEKPSVSVAMAIGFTIGIATICRPTDAIIFLIPLLWNTHTKASAAEKWQLVRKNQMHLLIAIGMCIVGILPQLIYWKLTTGQFVYNVGSKWMFLNPNFQVLFGFTNGWFIYTPITLFFALGLIFIKNFPFRNSVLYFCLLNIWIVIAWANWKYGATYSTRALVQSYPVFSLGFAAVLSRIKFIQLKIFGYVAGLYLIVVNVFQLYQYNETILHYRDMNRAYYGRIYLNPSPDALDMSYLDIPNMPSRPEDLTVQQNLMALENEMFYAEIKGHEFGNHVMLLDTSFSMDLPDDQKTWYGIETNLLVEEGLWGSHLYLIAKSGERSDTARVRLFNATTKVGETNDYYVFTPVNKNGVQQIQIFVSGKSNLRLDVRKLSLTIFNE